MTAAANLSEPPAKPSLAHRLALALAALGLLAESLSAAAWVTVWARDPYPTDAAPHRPPGLQAPIVETLQRRGAPGADDTFVVLYTGDNGWQVGDRGFAANLSTQGLPMVAVDSLRYFSRSPSRARASADLAGVIEGYASAWRRPRVILAGYSFGADALLQILPGLPPRTRARVAGVALVAPGRRSDLTLHPYTLFDLDKPTAMPAAALLASLRGTPATCVYGRDDPGAACVDWPAGIIAPRPVPGGHRFIGQFPAVARAIARTGAAPD